MRRTAERVSKFRAIPARYRDYHAAFMALYGAVQYATQHLYTGFYTHTEAPSYGLQLQRSAPTVLVQQLPDDESHTSPPSDLIRSLHETIMLLQDLLVRCVALRRRWSPL